MKEQFADKIRAGDSINDVFVLSEKITSKKRDGNSF